MIILTKAILMHVLSPFVHFKKTFVVPLPSLLSRNIYQRWMMNVNDDRINIIYLIKSILYELIYYFCFFLDNLFMYYELLHSDIFVVNKSQNLS